jgi:hypothetical protein
MMVPLLRQIGSSDRWQQGTRCDMSGHRDQPHTTRATGLRRPEAYIDHIVGAGLHRERMLSQATWRSSGCRRIRTRSALDCEIGRATREISSNLIGHAACVSAIRWPISIRHPRAPFRSRAAHEFGMAIEAGEPWSPAIC